VENAFLDQQLTEWLLLANCQGQFCSLSLSLIVISTHEISLHLPVFYFYFFFTDSHYGLGSCKKNVSELPSKRIAQEIEEDIEKHRIERLCAPALSRLTWRRVITTIKINYGNYFYAYFKYATTSGQASERRRNREKRMRMREKQMCECAAYWNVGHKVLWPAVSDGGKRQRQRRRRRRIRRMVAAFASYFSVFCFWPANTKTCFFVATQLWLFSDSGFVLASPQFKSTNFSSFTCCFIFVFAGIEISLGFEPIRLDGPQISWLYTERRLRECSWSWSWVLSSVLFI